MSIKNAKEIIVKQDGEAKFLPFNDLKEIIDATSPMEKQLKISKLLEKHNVKLSSSIDNIYHADVWSNSPRIEIPVNYDIQNEPCIFSLLHELGHILDKPYRFINHEKHIKKWKIVIKYEIDAWKIARKEFIKLFDKDISQESKDEAIRCLCTYIWFFKTVLIAEKKGIRNPNKKNEKYLLSELGLENDKEWYFMQDCKKRLRKILEY